MAFKKAKKPTTESNIDWTEFNKHVEEVVEEAIEENGSNLVCFVSGLIDTGTQPPEEEYTEYDWEDSERQNNLLKKDFGCYVEDGKFYIPNRSADSIIITVDFPDIMIDYGKFFSEDGKSDKKPYRYILSREWMGLAGITALTPQSDGYTPKSHVSVLAKATGAFKGKGKVPADFDVGELLGGVFTMDVEVDSTEKDGNYYVNVKAKSPSAKNKKIPDPEITVEPYTILMDGGNEEKALKELRGSIIKRLELAEEFEESELKKELIKVGKLQGGSSGKADGESKPKKATTKPKKVEQEPDEESDDDEDPFADMD